jgi:hypothetical protein
MRRRIWWTGLPLSKSIISGPRTLRFASGMPVRGSGLRPTERARPERPCVAAFVTSSGVLRLLRQHRVNLRHHGGTFSDRRRDPFGRAGANVADGEHAR